ncbi:ribosome recycling factor [Enterobacteriaceae endosymbiont of Donacia tomentosa]|uniref:ribosome recycling factor n=1 Tax=Enterobacteriaceae endosymbiont of Donacia tomentosa TaxID=2675787 RepID=UPI0014574A2F|nr:ribosome recycling factor [Enterobacteriaceae endosymbiont of Donacia tomentosa]
MKKILDLFIKKVNITLNNRISPHLLNNLTVKLYNKLIPINQLSSIVVDNYSTLKITPFDISIIKNIEKSIIFANLDLTTKIVNKDIFVMIPPMTESRKIKITKNLKGELELNRIAIRNIRKKKKNKLKILLKNKNISENQEKELQKQIQKKTSFYINKITNFFKKKIELFN